MNSYQYFIAPSKVFRHLLHATCNCTIELIFHLYFSLCNDAALASLTRCFSSMLLFACGSALAFVKTVLNHDGQEMYLYRLALCVLLCFFILRKRFLSGKAAISSFASVSINIFVILKWFMNAMLFLPDNYHKNLASLRLLTGIKLVLK